MSTQTAGDFASLLLGVSLAPNEIGRKIAAARERSGRTQLDFALELGVSPSTVQRWESGKLPRVKRLMEVADRLDLPIADLVQPETEPPSWVDEMRGLHEQLEDQDGRLDRIEKLLERLLGEKAG